MIVGPLSAGFVADHFGLRASFFTGAGVIVIGLIAAGFLMADDRVLAAARTAGRSGAATPPSESKPRQGMAGLPALRAAARLPGFVTVMAVLFLVQFVDRSFSPILPLYVESLGKNPAQVASYAGLVISLAAIATGISATTVGQLALRWPARRLLTGTLIAGAVLCLPLALVRTPTELLVARSLLGLFAGGTITLAYSLANQVVPSASKGAAFGVLSSMGMLGSALSPLVAGAIVQIDLRAVFVVNTIFYCVALFWAMRGPATTPASAAVAATGTQPGAA